MQRGEQVQSKVTQNNLGTPQACKQSLAVVKSGCDGGSGSGFFGDQAGVGQVHGVGKLVSEHRSGSCSECRSGWGSQERRRQEATALPPLAGYARHGIQGEDGGREGRNFEEPFPAAT